MDQKPPPSSLCSLPIWNASSSHLPLFFIILPSPFPPPEINLNVSWTHLYCWVAFPSLTRSIWPLLFAWSSSAWVPSFTSKILNFMNNFLTIRSIRMRRSPPREAVGSLSLAECKIWARQSNSGLRGTIRRPGWSNKADIFHLGIPGPGPAPSGTSSPSFPAHLCPLPAALPFASSGPQDREITSGYFGSLAPLELLLCSSFSFFPPFIYSK